MDNKLRELFGIDKLTVKAQKAAEIALNEAVYCEKYRRYYGLAQNINEFISAIGAKHLPKDMLVDLIEKTKLIVEHLAHNEAVNEGVIVPVSAFKWQKTETVPNFGLTSRSNKGGN